MSPLPQMDPNPGKIRVAAGGLTFSSDFDCGNLMRVERVGDVFCCWLARDCEGQPEHQRRNCNWFHFAVTRSGTAVRLFINGVQVGTDGVVTGTFGGAGTLTVGNYGGGGASYGWTGVFDEFRVTNGAARYTANFTVPTTANPTN